MDISTHTLTWSVTISLLTHIDSSLFQLTRSRGAWHPQLWPYNRQRYFNSHAHVERDNGSWYARWRASAFQLTRSRGAWRAVVINHNVYNEFQLTRSRGAWLLRPPPPPLPWHFNSHAHVERDLISSFVVKSEWNFNSHAHVERDSLTSSFIISLWYFNSHAHVERDHKVEWFERTCEHFNSHAHVERDVMQKSLSKSR